MLGVVDGTVDRKPPSARRHASRVWGLLGVGVVVVPILVCGGALEYFTRGEREVRSARASALTPEQLATLRDGGSVTLDLPADAKVVLATPYVMWGNGWNAQVGLPKPTAEAVTSRFVNDDSEYGLVVVSDGRVAALQMLDSRLPSGEWFDASLQVVSGPCRVLLRPIPSTEVGGRRWLLELEPAAASGSPASRKPSAP